MAKKTRRRETERASESAVGNTARFPIVGIGASAGGLEAMDAFFAAMPSDTGAGFVVVVHLSPTHASILPELLQRHTTMPVRQITAAVAVERDHIYVIPPDHDLIIVDGVCTLSERTRSPGVNLPIDAFFGSLALDQGRAAVGIILSGTGADGSHGVEAIKANGGMVMVQDEASAGYGDMPRGAIHTGLVDFVLPPGDMPEQLVKYIRHADRKAGLKIALTDGVTALALTNVFAILQERTGHDFSLYKKSTIFRRLERRLNLHQIDSLQAYVAFMRQAPGEVDTLFQELLIGVTHFFRDEQAFEALQHEIVQTLLPDRPDGYTLRVWVPGCSTGEEAYSLAILLRECVQRAGRHLHVQIFSTDLNEDAIAIARAGVYPERIRADVSAERLACNFTLTEDGRFRVKTLIRNSVVFAKQNVITDPPFTKLDLLSCRNLLIYFNAELQERLIPVFLYSLNSGGVLFLGSSLMLGQAAELFTVLNKKWKIYRRGEQVQSIHPARLPASHPSLLPSQARLVHVRNAEKLDALQSLEAILQHSDIPPTAIIDDDANVIYIHGRMGRFLEPAQGKASVNIVAMARPWLKTALADAIGVVGGQRRGSARKGAQTNVQRDGQAMVLAVEPIGEPFAMRGLMMVTFSESATTSRPQKNRLAEVTQPSTTRTGEPEQRVHDFESGSQDPQTANAALQAANEELKLTNEELQSTNEELQSTNEELQTSKEELQSLNEESSSVNTELQGYADKLAKLNDDMKNLLEGTEIAFIFLDQEMRVRRFTRKAALIVPLMPTDIGRPINDLNSMLVNTNLSQMGEVVLTDLVVRQSEVQSHAGCTYRMTVRPYRTLADIIDGVVISFEDITELRHSRDALRTSEKTRRLVFQLAKVGAAEVNITTGLGTWTPEFAQIWDIPDSYSGDFTAYCWTHVHADDLDRVRREFEAIAAGGKTIETTFRIVRSDGEMRWIWWRGQLLDVDAGDGPRAALVNVDITDARLQTNSQERIQRLLAAALKNAASEMIIAHVDTLARYTWSCNQHGIFADASIIGKRDVEILDNAGTRKLQRLKERALAGGAGVTEEVVFPLASGERRYVVTVKASRDPNGEVDGAVSTAVRIADATNKED